MTTSAPMVPMSTPETIVESGCCLADMSRTPPPSHTVADHQGKPWPADTMQAWLQVQNVKDFRILHIGESAHDGMPLSPAGVAATAAAGVASTVAAGVAVAARVAAGVAAAVAAGVAVATVAAGVAAGVAATVAADRRRFSGADS